MHLEPKYSRRSDAHGGSGSQLFAVISISLHDAYVDGDYADENVEDELLHSSRQSAFIAKFHENVANSDQRSAYSSNVSIKDLFSPVGIGGSPNTSTLKQMSYSEPTKYE